MLRGVEEQRLLHLDVAAHDLQVLTHVRSEDERRVAVAHEVGTHGVRRRDLVALLVGRVRDLEHQPMLRFEDPPPAHGSFPPRTQSACAPFFTANIPM